MVSRTDSGMFSCQRAGSRAARWHENMPLSVLGAMAAAVPSVVSDLGGLPELVEHGHDGLVVGVDDPDALAAAMGRLAARPAEAEALGRAARAKAIAHHGASDHLAHLEAIYRDVRQLAPRR
ncbi:MAG: glycosyltransferase [Acidimicrobiia bacterium]|nr:glycosyltransferase [Acidimicrobiia bacterium]